MRKNVVTERQGMDDLHKALETSKAAERQLNEQSEAYKSIVDATFDAVLILDTEGLIVEHNDVAGQIFGHVSNQLAGSNIKALLFTYKPLFNNYEQLEKEIVSFRSQACAASSEQATYFDCRAKVFNYKNSGHILLMLRDISDFLRAEADLKKSRSFSATITETSPVVLFLTNDSAQLTFINPLWFKWTGAPIERHVNSGWMDFILAEDRELFKKVFRESFNTRKMLDVDLRLQLAAGVRWVNLHAESYYHEENVFAGLAGSMMDITARKIAEANLYKKNQETQEELARQVKERTTELEKMNYELLQFSSIASHDLKEPVRKISIFSKILLSQLNEQLDARHRRFLQNISNSAGRMMNLINDLLSFSRLSHVEEPRFENTDLGELIRNVVDDLELAVNEKKATVSIGEMPVIRCIAFQITQVFQNLLSNSLKFSDPSRPLHISITAQPSSEAFVRIEYTDSGIGFEESFSEKIFEVFQRLHAKDRYEGTGIGLSIVKKIITQHQGHVQATGEPGKGSRFTIILPYDPESMASLS